MRGPLAVMRDRQAVNLASLAVDLLAGFFPPGAAFFGPGCANRGPLAGLAGP